MFAPTSFAETESFQRDLVRQFCAEHASVSLARPVPPTNTTCQFCSSSSNTEVIIPCQLISQPSVLLACSGHTTDLKLSMTYGLIQRLAYPVVPQQHHVKFQAHQSWTGTVMAIYLCPQRNVPVIKLRLTDGTNLVRTFQEIQEANPENSHVIQEILTWTEEFPLDYPVLLRQRFG